MIQKNNYIASIDATSHVLTFSQATVNTNTLILIVTSTAIITTPVGWTKIGGNLSALDMGAYRRAADGTETSVTMTISASRGLTAIMYEFDDLTTTIGTSNGLSSTSSGDIQFNRYTATDASRVFFFIGTEPAQTASGTTWSTSELDTNRDALHVIGVTNTQSQLSSFANVPMNGFVDAIVFPGVTSAYAIQGITFDIRRIVTVPIVVNTGVDQNVMFAQNASISGTAVGGNGSSFSYLWTVISGPAGSFTSASLLSTTFEPSGAGIYTLRLSATDTSGTGFDDVVVTVEPERTYFVRRSNSWQMPAMRVRSNNDWV